jgi:hypothetical protein
VMYMAPHPIKAGQQKKKATAPAAPKPEKEETHAQAEEQPRSDETVS